MNGETTRRWLRHSANGLTTLRLVLVFVAAVLAVLASPSARAWAAAVVILAVVLDWADGWAARRASSAHTSASVTIHVAWPSRRTVAASTWRTRSMTTFP